MSWWSITQPGQILWWLVLLKHYNTGNFFKQYWTPNTVQYIISIVKPSLWAWLFLYLSVGDFSVCLQQQMFQGYQWKWNIDQYYAYIKDQRNANQIAMWWFFTVHLDLLGHFRITMYTLLQYRKRLEKLFALECFRNINEME